MLGGRVLFEQILDALVGLFAEQRLGATRTPVVEGGAPFLTKRDATAYTVVRAQKSTREISVGESPSALSSAMCIRSLLLGRLSRFISAMRLLRF